MNAHETVSRRTFITAIGATGVALGLGSLATGCSPQGSDEPQALGNAGADDIAWTDEADVVVVGLGAAGAAAAVAAREEGATVIALEAADQAGGTTALSGGLIYMGGGTSVQQRLGIEDTPENFKAYLTKAVGPSADAELLDIFCASSPDLCAWCIDHGMAFDGDADETSHVVEAPEGISLMYSGNERAADYASIATPAPRGHAPSGGAASIVDSLLQSAGADLDIRFGTALSELVTDNSGAVVGVKAEGPDGLVAVRAGKGVILATGAFTNNDEIVENYRPEVLSCRGRTAGPLDRGDGMIAAQKIGAAVRGASRMTVGAHVYMYEGLPKGALLNHRGQRILAEDWYGSFIGRTILENTLSGCFVIIDQTTYDEAMGSPYAAGLTNITSADSIEALAEKSGLDAGRTAESIARYNEFCRTGVDEDFGKSSEYLVPIEQGPFYAVSVLPQDFSAFFTLGGLKIDGSARVINLDGKPINGLYAAGRCSCGIFGEYAGSGSSIADGLTFGRIAGQAAATR